MSFLNRIFSSNQPSLTADEWANKAFALDDQGKYDEAIVCYDEAIALEPKDVDTWNNKGAALFNQGKYEEAVVCYDEAITLDLTNATAIEGHRRCRRRLLRI